MFRAKNFCHIASNNRNNVKVGVFVYRTTDNLATVLVSGYFNERIIDINLHDIIIHEKIDATDNTKVEKNVLCVTERTLDNVGTTVIKSKWEGDIEQEIEDLRTYVNNNFVKIDGTSIMTGPLKMRASISFECAIAPYWHGVGFYGLNDDDSITLLASMEADDGFCPYGSNKYNMGSTYHKWKNLYLAGKAYVGTINNGGDLAVPTVSGTLATKEDVDLAANSGDQLYSTGVWYAKMYAGTTPPASAEVEGRNYADFSQTDGSGNPVIKVYTYTSGSWTLTDTIVPPTEYNGYMTITSKIWDISEQAGQQGGKVLWSHNQKTFTPYPQIISFENAALTGVSTAPTPDASSPNNQIANKEYVDNATSGAGYHPDLFDVKWSDHQINDIQWLRGDTFSWQDGSVYQAAYQHLVDDFDNIPRENIVYVNHTSSPTGYFYRDSYFDVSGAAHPYAYVRYNNDGSMLVLYANHTTGESSDYYYENADGSGIYYFGGFSSGTVYIRPIKHDTINGTVISFYEAQDGHKIAPERTLLDISDNRPMLQSTNVASIYNDTGVAWYYILDTVNQRFKLPRTQYGFTGLRDTVEKYVEAGLPNITAEFTSTNTWGGGLNLSGAAELVGSYGNGGYGGGNGRPNSAGTVAIKGSNSSTIYGNSTTVQPPATQMYLYFYVGSFTQTAIENTAGLNASLFNGKADVDLSNTALATADYVVEKQDPTALNNYTWYRKYKSGWVEQGGVEIASGAMITLPIAMADTKYTVQTTPTWGTANSSGTRGMCSYLKTTTSFYAQQDNNSGSFDWQVSGMAAN